MDEVHTLIGAYVLDAVDDVERAAVERHLAGCEVCAAEAAELREAAARLAESTAQPPPPGLRERVLAEAAQTRQARPTGRQPRPGGSARWRRWTAVAVAACLVAVGGGFAAWSVQQQRVYAERVRAEAARERADQAQRRADDIATVLAAPDAVTRRVEVAGGGRVTVVVSARQDRAVVVLDELRRTPAGKAYQLWLIKGAQPRSAGVLPSRATKATQLLYGLGGADLLGVTVEPAGGSRQPTTTPIAAIELR